MKRLIVVVIAVLFVTACDQPTAPVPGQAIVIVGDTAGYNEWLRRIGAEDTLKWSGIRR